MANELYDALFARFIISALPGNLIKTSDCLKSVDHSRYPTLPQFSIICSYIEDTTLDFEEDAEKTITDWADEVKELSEYSNSTWSRKAGKKRD